jgi:hypothetical protein
MGCRGEHATTVVQEHLGRMPSIRSAEAVRVLKPAMLQLLQMLGDVFALHQLCSHLQARDSTIISRSAGDCLLCLCGAQTSTTHR